MIGIFDSGVGGLSVLKEIKRLSPNIDIVYYGDIKNAPYGEKKLTELKKLTRQSIEILQKKGVKNIFSACNSVSVFMLDFKGKDLKIMEMIGPTVSGVIKVGRIGNNGTAIFATPATINAGIYQREFLKNGFDIKTFPFPKLAGAIEFGEDLNKVEKIINKNIDGNNFQNISNIILCCTHYPFVKSIFQKVFDSRNIKINIIDPSQIVAKKVIEEFGEKGSGKLEFLISKESENFRNMITEIFKNYDYSIKVV